MNTAPESINTRRMTLLIAIVLAIGTGFLTLNYVLSVRRTAVMPSATSQVSAPSKNAPMRVPALLAPGQRAISISIDHAKGISGLLQSGDVVDVIAVPPKVGNQPPRALTIVRGAKVLALDEDRSSGVTLAVTPQQANVLASAGANAVLQIALRSPRESIGSLAADKLVFPEPPRPATNRVAAAVPAQSHPISTPPGPSVTIIEEDRVVQWSQSDAKSAGVMK